MLIDPEIWDSYTKIGFVRHPYMWARSMYRKGSGGVLGAVGIDSSGSFEEYLEALELTPYSWFVDSKGVNLMDRIYRTEDLSAIGIEYDIKIKHMNKTNSDREAEKSEEVERLLKQKFYREYRHYPKGDIYGL